MNLTSSVKLFHRGLPNFAIAYCTAVVLLLSGCGGSTGANSGQSPSAKADARKDKFVSALGLSDRGISEKLFSSIDSAISGVTGAEGARREDVLAKEGDLVQLGVERTGGGVSTDQMVNIIDSMSGGEHWRKIHSAKEGVNGAMVAAAEEVAKSSPGTSDYDARKKVFQALRTSWKERSWYFEPQYKLVAFDPAPAKPVVDDEYRVLMEQKENFWENELYKKLTTLPPAELPDGALMPLLSLSQTNIPTALLRDGWVVTPTQLVERYGERACNTMVYFLMHPEEFGVEFNEIPYNYHMRSLRSCPSEMRKEFIRGAMLSGWKAVENYVPGNEEWADALLDEFEDSPYGAPIRNPAQRPLTPEEERLVAKRMEQYKERYQNEQSGDQSADYKLRWQLEQELKFDNTKLAQAFSAEVRKFFDSST